MQTAWLSNTRSNHRLSAEEILLAVFAESLERGDEDKTLATLCTLGSFLPKGRIEALLELACERL